MSGKKATAAELLIRRFIDAFDRESRLRNEWSKSKLHRDAMIREHFAFIRTEKRPDGLIEYDEVAIARYVSLARHQLERSASEWPEQGEER